MGGGLDAARSLAVIQTTTLRWSLADDLAGYARAGIAGIGLYRPKLEEFEEDLAIHLVRSSGLAVSSISWVGGLTGSDGWSQDEALFDAGEAIRFAAAVEAGTVCVVSGGAGSHITRHARRLLCDGLKKLCDIAAQFDVRVSLHPFSAPAARRQSVLTSLDELLEVIAAVGEPQLGLVFDLAELSREQNLLARIPEVAELIHVVKLCDRRARTDWQRQFADGPVPLTAVAAALVDAGYDGPFEFDLWSDTGRPVADYEGLLACCRGRFESFGLPVSPQP